MSSRQGRATDWTRTVEQLAAANQQLAAAQSLALGELCWFFGEFKRTRSDVDRSLTDCATDCPRCRNDGKTVAASGPGRLLVRKRGLKCVGRKRYRRNALAAIQRIKQNEEFCDSSESKSKAVQTDRLMNDWNEQRLLVQRIRRDFQDSQEECAKRGERLEEALSKLSNAELANARLLDKLETFQREVGQADRRDGERASPTRSRLVGRDDGGPEQRTPLALEQLADDDSSQVSRRESDSPAPGNSASPFSRGISLSPALSTEETPEPAVDAVDCASSIEEFKRELTAKREARQRAIAAISAELERLRRELAEERTAHSETAQQLQELRQVPTRRQAEKQQERAEGESPERLEASRLSDLLKVSDEMMSDLWLQLERTDDLRFQLENDPEEHRLRIGQLRRLAEETRSSLRLRRQQIGQLKDRLAQIVVRLGERGFADENADVRREVERQIEDIARSRQLCDERWRIMAELKEHCAKQVHELRVKLDASRKENESLEEEMRRTEDRADAHESEILNLESQLGLARADCRDLQNQTTLINSLFGQMLLGASSAEMDLDRLTRLLEENHDLISEMARENGSDTAALPKLLIDIIDQVNGRSRDDESAPAIQTEQEESQEESIAHNLPKVWRVLLELLSCHAKGGASASAPTSGESAPDSCYKSVDTPAGPRLVISVSKTYIRLKELILEKKHLERETNRMKQLNTHLESKLSEQEKRLSAVSDELTKTWSVVGRMQAQHQQLHTHEKILRYELQQKRKMLQELKQELEYCREKWESARQKNNNTEIEWMSLRREFAARKALIAHADSFNTSGESGFSDDREEETDEELGTEVGKRSRPVNSRKRSRKDDSRALTPDTESEQPTDTEFSESKTASSSLQSDQRTPTPETEADLETAEAAEDVSSSRDTSVLEPEKAAGGMPGGLDEALSRVICNLMAADQSRSHAEDSSDPDPNERDEESSSVDRAKAVSFAPMSVFSIGPHPSQSVESVQFGGPLAAESHRLSGHSADEAATARLTTSFGTPQEEPDGSRVPQGGEEPTLASTAELDARAARLRRLEEQAQWLVRKVNDTNRRGCALSSRLEELHEAYGTIPPAPPMPDVLPVFRIRAEEGSVDDDEDDKGRVNETPS